MDSVQHTAGPACIPVRSAVSTMEAPPWRVLPVDDQALAEGSMGAAAVGSMGAAAVDPMAVEAEGRLPLHHTNDGTN